MLCWKDNVSELKTSISTVTEACDEVRKSKGLKMFINLVLVAGNFMGRTKTSKDTFAFELSVLNKVWNFLESNWVIYVNLRAKVYYAYKSVIDGNLFYSNHVI